MGFLAGRGCPLPFVLRRKAVGKDDSGAALALVDITAKAERLTIGEPALARIAVFDCRSPEDQHIDSRIASAGDGILRYGERHFRRGRPPGLHLRDMAAFSSVLILPLISS